MSNPIYYRLYTDEDIKVFHALVRLAQGRSYQDQYSIEGDQIKYVVDGTTFFYWVDENYGLTGGGGAGAMGESSTGQGKYWFKEMRGEQIDDAVMAQNVWKSLITDVANRFYKQNPCLVYNNSNQNLTPNRLVNENKLKNIVKLFFGVDNINAEKVKHGGTIQDIYAVSVRMGLTVSGEPKPVIGKLFFTVSDRTLVFLDTEAAREIAMCLENIQPNDAMGTELNVQEDFNKFFNELEKQLKREDLDLTKKLVLNEDNQEVVDNLAKQLETGEEKGAIDVIVKEIKTNILIVIKMRVETYNLYFPRYTSDSEAGFLRATVLFDKLSLFCGICEKENGLINNNVILYKDEEGIEHTLEIVFSEQNDYEIGFIYDGQSVTDREDKELYDTIVRDVKQYVFSKHLLRVSCSACGSRKECSKYVCERKQEHVIVYGRDGKEGEEIRCADCAYPEIFVRIGDKSYSPQTLYFDVDERVLKYGEHEYCQSCGRAIDKEKTHCNLCMGLLNDQNLKQQKKLYKSYRRLVSLSSRMGKNKRCAEDLAYIVMRVGNKTFAFDKLNGYKRIK